MMCQCCGRDVRFRIDGEPLRLQEVKTFDEKGRPRSLNLCQICRPIILAGNHVDNQNLQNEGDQAGYMKPPQKNDYPGIRPS
jgi:hypothetical protein